MPAQLTLVLGGIASGKSAFAEGLVRQSGKPMIYLATAQAFDDEMTQKIARHRKARGPGWHTIEEPLAVAQRLRDIAAGHCVLLDCATLWLSNHLLSDSDLEAETHALLAGLADCTSDLVVVSNEVGLAGVPDNALARRFANAQGRLNQSIAARAARVILVTAGLPVTLKGPVA
ncbi:bifunctional adenosylcobinamide kinase/adenosylcobinamide-phosphate guanylyltransferase [Aquicoccus porphyridii]|uniref:Bifunctional adenosylcobalamin biosynthesis protein n=1 Tax=Aquicoccus porphyridii TaxID=1852029 RepID=A0A5A9YYG6_9RHOB|nr:bifunctional adenosylcobinamide kinase/adenosylcobinamide-phosphate guanylyltransferase [Aquicoccus porphyridii]KAA0909867.1 bifunctional adenosylcobinamide kinase/adenosylcobinamide-phosphate guanylyltransferase [Aquicoccus porphyridii]RAI53222.1 bifunctional adenosylcobinamide kinase/adenosylcobinamide-phosphate guanylyltransferase [Rhodobacteraceae bacterium AsT-22]